MMPRPQRCRRICEMPQVDCFSPEVGREDDPILLTLDEYEVIRLVDLEGKNHGQLCGTDGYFALHSAGNL